MGTVGTLGDAQSNTHSAPPLLAMLSEYPARLIQPHIHTLPLEILGKIFILSLASDEQIVKYCWGAPIWRYPPSPWKNPLPLCAVSSLWRSIALATPQLWQRVFVRVPLRISRVAAKSKAQDLVPWIERAGSLPLTLFIRHPSMPHLEGPGAGDPIVKILECYASRWEALYFQDAGYGNGEDWNLLDLIRLDKWSSLRRMHGVRPRDTINLWAQLTYLQMHHRVDYPRAVDIFKGCPRLVSLSLQVDVDPDFFNVPASPITLHDLSCLSFTTNNSSAIIQLISLPSLREISVCRTSSPPMIDLASFKSLLLFLTRSACTLDKLDMRGTVPSLPDDLLQILAHRSCHFLTSLTIHQKWDTEPYCRDDVLVNNDVLLRLTLHHHDSVCTHLKYLALGCEASLSALPNMVESRIGSNNGHVPDGLLDMLDLQLKNFIHGQELYEIVKRSGMKYDIKPGTYTSRSLRLRRSIL